MDAVLLSPHATLPGAGVGVVMPCPEASLPVAFLVAAVGAPLDAFGGVPGAAPATNVPDTGAVCGPAPKPALAIVVDTVLSAAAVVAPVLAAARPQTPLATLDVVVELATWPLLPAARALR